MSRLFRLRGFVPYIVLLIGALYLFGVADRISFMPVPGQSGPALWPKIVLTLLIGVCIFEIGRRTLWSFSGTGATERAVRREMGAEPGALDTPGADDADPMLEAHGADHPWRVVGTVVATILYLLALETTGFFLSTIVYSAALMWFGGTRRPFVMVVMSLALSTFFTFVFMKVIFVALPIGHGPFQTVSLAIMALLGIR